MDDEIIGTITTATGFVERIENPMRPVPVYDPRSGDHFWAAVTLYKVNPEQMMEGSAHLDHESLVSVQGPFCFFCEEFYTPKLLKRRCPGDGQRT